MRTSYLTILVECAMIDSIMISKSSPTIVIETWDASGKRIYFVSRREKADLFIKDMMNTLQKNNKYSRTDVEHVVAELRRFLECIAGRA